MSLFIYVFNHIGRLFLRSSSYRDPDSLSGGCLGKPERTAFVNVVLKLIDRGQYSKNEHLSETVAAATSILSYVEPSLVLPFVASRFHLALETVCNLCSLRYLAHFSSLIYSIYLRQGKFSSINQLTS